MASFLSKIFALRSSKSIRVPAIETYDIENPVEKTARTLFHLVKLNHINHSVRIREGVLGSLSSYNIVPHVRVSLPPLPSNVYIYIELEYEQGKTNL